MKRSVGALAIVTLGLLGASSGAAPESTGPAEAQAQPAPAAQPSPTPSEESPAAGAGQPVEAPSGEEGEQPEGGAATGAPPPRALPPAASAAAESCDPKVDICLIADEQGREKGHFWGRGFADLRFGDLEVQTDSIDIYEVEKNGVLTQKLVAQGNVVLLRKEERLTGQTMTMDLDTGQGTMDDVVGYVEPGVYFTAKRVDRLNPTTFRIKTGRFTSCCQANPSWSFNAARATLKVGKRITADRVRFNLGVPAVGAQVPALYIPYFVYPINEDQRSTGFLFPDFNIDFKRGVDVKAGFFWAMGRSFDQTFYAEYRPKLAPLLGYEFHYALESPSRGAFVTHLFPPQSSSAAPVAGLAPPSQKWDYSLKWNAVQVLPGGFQAKAIANVTSPEDYLLPVVSYYANRNLSLTVQRTFGRQALLIQGTSQETLTPDGRNPNRLRLPQIRLSQAPNPIGDTGVLFEYGAQLDRLSLRKTIDSGPLRNDWTRFDVGPALSRPVNWSFLSFTPRVAARYTHYNETMGSDGQGNFTPNQPYTGPALGRRYVEASAELRGPRFARVFKSPIGAFSDKIKHVIGPEIKWVYRSAVGANQSIPIFDAIDNTFAAHEVRYGLVNRFYSHHRSQGGKVTPYEFFSWTVYQKYYINPPLTDFDPDFTSRLLTLKGADGQNLPIRKSPIRSVMSFKPLPAWSIDWTEEYDTRAKTATRRDLRLGMSGAWGRLRAGWTRQPEVKDIDGTLLLPPDETVGGDAQLQISHDHLTVGASAHYSLVQKLFVDRSVQLRLGGQCLGALFSVMERQYYPGQKPIRSIGFSIELANLGSIGMDPSRGLGGLGGGRMGSMVQ